MLTLPIKKQWFEMIAAGIKKEEYREIKPYYEGRLQNLFGAIILEPLDRSKVDVLQGDQVPEEIRREAVQPIIFRNGYSKNSPELLAKCSLSVGTGRPEWGAEPGQRYFILTIHEVKILSNKTDSKEKVSV